MPNGQIKEPLQIATITKTKVKTHHLALIGIAAVCTALTLGAFTANFAVVSISLVSSTAQSVGIATTSYDCSFGYKWDGTKCAKMLAHSTCRVAEGYYDVTEELAGECYTPVKYNYESIESLARARPECVRYACGLTWAQERGQISSRNLEKLCMREIDDYDESYSNLLDCIDLDNAYGPENKLNRRAASIALADLERAIKNNDEIAFDSVMKTRFDIYFKNQFKYAGLYRIHQSEAINGPNIFGSWASAEFEFDNPESDFLPNNQSAITYNIKFQPKDIRDLNSGYSIIFMTEKDPAEFNPTGSISTATVKDNSVSISTGSTTPGPCDVVNGKVASVDCYDNIYDLGCFSSELCDAYGISPDCDDYSHYFCQTAAANGLNCQQYGFNFDVATQRFVRDSEGVPQQEIQAFALGHAMNFIELRNPARYCLIEPQGNNQTVPFVIYCWPSSEGTNVSENVINQILIGSFFMPHWRGYGYVEGTYESEIRPGDYRGAIEADAFLSTLCSDQVDQEVRDCVSDEAPLCAPWLIEVGDWCAKRVGDGQCQSNLDDSRAQHFCSDVTPNVWPWPNWVDPPEFIDSVDDWGNWGVCATFDGGWSYPLHQFPEEGS